MAAKRKRAPVQPALGKPTPRTRIKRLREQLLAWYDTSHRDLPWRTSRDPYAIWISETMLQQTRVETVIPYYDRFLERFPDIDSLATADREEVFEHWAGLGYYSRARNLHESAKKMVDDFGSSVPNEVDQLRTLPGVGRYTAGAVASIAFDKPEAVVDGNVVRVLTRLLDIRADVSHREVQGRLWEEAGALAKGPRPGDLNQALMEFGATVCTPRSPGCKTTCPLARLCHGLRAGKVDQLPNKPKKKKPRAADAIAVWLPRRSKLLAVQRPEQGLLANLWELPGAELPQGAEPKDHVARLIRERTGLEVINPLHAGTVEHIFTHLKLNLHVFRCSEAEGRVKLTHHQAHRWVSATAFSKLPLATLTRKALELLL